MKNFPVINAGDDISPPYFYGAFENIQDIPNLGHPIGFETDKWTITALHQFYNIQKQRVLEEHLRPFCGIVHDRLRNGEKLKILDFGGGIGDNFVQIKNALPEPFFNNIEYTVIDNAKSIKTARSLHKDIHCHETIEQALQQSGPFNLVLFSGVLMYVDDSPGLVKYIKESLNCDMYITRTLFTETANTFTTIQHISPGIGPFMGTFIGTENSTICNLEQFIRSSEIKKEQIAICDAYQPYAEALRNLPPAYQNVHYYTLYVTNAQKCPYNSSWYKASGKTWHPRR